MPIIKTGVALTACLVLSACGSSSSGESAVEQIFEDAESATGLVPTISSDSGANEPQGVTNFAISGFVGTSVYTNRFEWIATVTNTGSFPGELPTGGLLLESTTPDFSSGSAISYTSVVRTDEVDDRELQPGESVEITGYNTVAGFSRLMGGFAWTDSHVRFVLNPDYGLFAFANPDEGSGTYESQYAQEEERYDDNTTDTILVMKEQYGIRRCETDPYEENDSLETAAAITLDTEYSLTLCEDSFDIFDIQLNADTTYEVVADGFDFEHGLTMRLIILDPDNNFTLDKTGVFGIFRAPTSGSYKVVITSPFGSDHETSNEGSFTIIER